MLVSNNNYQINLNSSSFQKSVEHLAPKVDEIIETGTFNGLGSTTVFAKTSKPVFTIESCFEHYQQAVQNLKNYQNVKLLYGSSLNVEQMITFIERDDIYDSDLPSTGHTVLTFDIEVEMISGLPNTKEAENEITAIAAQDNITRVYDVFVLDKQRKIKQNGANFNKIGRASCRERV